MILVCGASGELGGRIARRLLERGASVRVLLRSQADSTELEQRGAAGVKRFVWLSPVSGLDWEKGKLTIFRRGNAPPRYVAIDRLRRADWDDQPLRALGLEPRPAGEFIARTVGAPNDTARRAPAG